MKLRILVAMVFVCVLGLTGLYQAGAWTPLPVEDDPLVRMPGTQPGQATLEGPGRCLNCHGDYNHAVEPGFNWKGSMMAQASRDFLFWACMTVSAQDSIHAAGRPNATDICIRCHFPVGWLQGRSDPTNASLMRGDDYDGVNCDLCHTTYDPFFEETYAGTREGSDWLGYWDETNASSTPSDDAAWKTYLEDKSVSSIMKLFNGNDLFADVGGAYKPGIGTYTVNAGGQYFVSPNSAKRSSYSDAEARHQMLYSRYHKSKYMCSTCHDISNPVLQNLAHNGTPPGDGTTILGTEELPTYAYFHVERTFSEFMLSAYAQQGGSAGIGPFAPEVFETSYADNAIAKCQDCHMRDVVGVGCNKKGVPLRPGQSAEHPESGLPLHDMTGGNAWVSYVLASAMPGAANYDQFNYDQLNQGPAALTLDMTVGRSADPEAILAAVDRSKQQLLLAASIDDISYDAVTGDLSFKVQNRTGHKLISGFPEGRRMFVNVKAYSGGSLLYEANPYDYDGGTLKGLLYPYIDGQGIPHPAVLGPNDAYVDELVYEAHTSSLDITGEAESFHFALATDRYKDNRIPPKGFNIGGALERLSQPRWHGEDALDYYTAAEYAGGYDDVTLSIPAGADYVEVNLYYQTTAREYIEFLRDEIRGPAGGGNLTLPESAYVIQSDDFFTQLRAWGDTIWNLWTHNMNVDGARPFLMAQAAIGTPGEGCDALAPELLTATPASQEVILTWTEIPADPSYDGYRLYYDQSGKAQLVADISSSPLNTYTDTGLTNGQEVCYKVTAYYGDCESDFSNILCATPNAPGQETYMDVDTLAAGKYVDSAFVLWGDAGNPFNAGDTVVIRATVVEIDPVTGLPGPPVSNVSVDISITGPESVTLTTNPSDADGIADATWRTRRPRGKKPGTTPGLYTATVTDVSGGGYTWDPNASIQSVEFNIQ